jgi:tetratricopeptide (TPR) repeat protein
MENNGKDDQKPVNVSGEDGAGGNGAGAARAEPVAAPAQTGLVELEQRRDDEAAATDGGTEGGTDGLIETVLKEVESFKLTGDIHRLAKKVFANEDVVVLILENMPAESPGEMLTMLQPFAATHFAHSAKVQAALGKSYFNRSRFEEAVKFLDRSLEIDEENPSALAYKIGALTLRTGDGHEGRLAEAEKVALEALADFSENAEVLAHCGTLYTVRSEYEKAEELFDRLLKVEPKMPRGYVLKLNLLRQMAGKKIEGKLEEAARLAEEAANKFPDNALVLAAQGQVLSDQGKYAEASEAFIRAKKDDGIQSVARALRARRRFEEAGQILKRADETLTESAVVTRELGELRLARGEFDAALGTFKRALRRAGGGDDEGAVIGKIKALFALQRPGDAEACIVEATRKEKFQKSASFWNELAALHYDQKRWEEAIKAADTSLTLPQPGSFPLQIKISSLRTMSRAGREKERKARFEEAERLAEDALNKPEKDADIYVERGWLYFDQEKFEEAEECFETACAEAGPNRLYTRLMANLGQVDVLNRQGRTNEAERLFESLKKSHPDDLLLLSQCGWFHIQRGDLDRAKEEFEACLKLDGQSIEGLNGLGGVCFDQGLYREAEDYFRRASRLSPNEAVIHSNLGWALMRRGEPWHLSEAEAECLKAVELDRTYHGAYGCLGVIAFKRGQLQQSEAYLRDSIHYGGRNGNYTDLGALYTQMGRYEEAKKQFDEAIKNNENDFQAHLELGNLYFQTDRVKEAVWEFRRARAINPRQEEAHRSLAAALMRAGESAEAEQVLRAAVRSLDSNKGQLWRLHLLLSQLLVKRGEDAGEDHWYKEAQEAADAAIRHAPEREVDPYLQRGIVSHKLGDNRSAQRYFRKCLERGRDPEHYEANRNLRLVRDLRKRENRLEWGSLLGGIVIGLASLGMLVILWSVYLLGAKDGRVTEKMLLIMSPILLGLSVVAFLLPYLAKLKMPGLEAELTKPQVGETLPSGPKGSISVSLPGPSGGGPR